ncbi:MAG: hypothetical protein K1X57_06390 [Gemmataceae bacterium]|nr:hypothetical protein [Gemmataceae bacterium]
MAVVLRAGGREFDVDAFLGGCTLTVCGVHRRGEPMFPASQPTGRRHEASNINFEVSDAGFNRLADQVGHAVEFLRSESEQVRRLCGWPGVEGVTLDFGVAWRDDVTHSDHLPAELVRLAGGLGLALEVSHYPVAEKSNDAEPV